MIKILDDFFEDIDAEFEKATNAIYNNFMDYGGTTWSQFSQVEDAISTAKVSKLLGFEVEASFPGYYRKYREEDVQPTYIHSDVNEGEWTLLVFLNKVNNNNGLAFWEHINGQNRAEKSNIFTYLQDTNDVSKWQGPSVVPAIFNRAVLFESAEFHSRWPKDNWNVGSDIRLVKVLFFKRKITLPEPSGVSLSSDSGSDTSEAA